MLKYITNRHACIVSSALYFSLVQSCARNVVFVFVLCSEAKRPGQHSRTQALITIHVPRVSAITCTQLAGICRNIVLAASMFYDKNPYIPVIQIHSRTWVS
jgi:hypothetical protein